VIVVYDDEGREVRRKDVVFEGLEPLELRL